VCVCEKRLGKRKKGEMMKISAMSNRKRKRRRRRRRRRRRENRLLKWLEKDRKSLR